MPSHTKPERKKKAKRVSKDIRKEKVKGIPQKKSVAIALSKERQRSKKRK